MENSPRANFPNEEFSRSHHRKIPQTIPIPLEISPEQYPQNISTCGIESLMKTVRQSKEFQRISQNPHVKFPGNLPFNEKFSLQKYPYH